MATQSPFSFLGNMFERIAAGPPLPQLPQWLLDKVQPPQWLVHEVQHRAVLFLNHVLMQESAATERMARQRGRVARLQWRGFSMALLVTPAGLFDIAPEFSAPDLHLQVTQTSPLDLAQGALRGDKPGVRIEGDVALAGDLQWLADHLRWDAEEDLARFLGDVPANVLASLGRRVAQALSQFAGSRNASAAASESFTGADNAPRNGS